MSGVPSFVFAFGLAASFAVAQDSVRFNRDVRPLLADRCFHCHGPDEESREAGLRLDRADGPEGALTDREGTRAIVPGAPEQSALWKRITTIDESDRMPPPDSHKQPLSDAQRDVIRRWIEQGATYEAHWSFVPPAEPEQPPVEDASWVRDPIDRFILRTLERDAVRPSAEADARTLIRRLTLDLIGLPPTRAEIHAFLADESPDAYERVVDRLLADPRYGEHMGRYWLDLVRFADTNGVHHDHFRAMSPYRDWVIRAFQSNMPFDEFVRDQLAGDLQPEPTRDQQIASGFHRLHLIIDRGTMLPEESLARNVIDRTTAFGTVFLGLTVGCAVCHDHKYDPVRQRDFYQLSAFFNNLDARPETGGRGSSDFYRGLQPPYVEMPSKAQAERLAEFDRQLAAEGADKKRLQRERRKFLRDVPAAMVMKERAEPREAFILNRGAYDDPGERVERDTPAFLPPLPSDEGARSRAGLAEWLVTADHPLFARVAVNRLWQQLFGVGIVKTSEDFGRQGEWPSHPDLLDHLAVSFRTSGWNVKSLMKRMVLSATYRQSSDASAEAFRRDPDNRRLARGSRFRLDAEVLRDQVLATGGLLSSSMFGPSVKPPQPAGVWKAVTLPDSFPRVFQADTGDKVRRRSVYTFWKRGMPPPQMTILNAPTREFCVARRERTNTPLQSLLLLNESEYLKAARNLARITLEQPLKSNAERLAFAHETITSHLPDSQESWILLPAFRDLRRRYSKDASLAESLCGGLDLPPNTDLAEFAAWTMVVSMLQNLDITKTRQ